MRINVLLPLIIMFFYNVAYADYIITPIKTQNKITDLVNNGNPNNRVINFSQSFHLENLNPKDEFDVITSQLGDNSDESWRPMCTVSIYDKKYDSTKDKEIEQADKLAEARGGSVMLWSDDDNHAYDGFYAPCSGIDAIAFLEIIKNKRPLIIISKADMYKVICYNGFKYTQFFDNRLDVLYDKNIKNVLQAKSVLKDVLIKTKFKMSSCK